MTADERLVAALSRIHEVALLDDLLFESVVWERRHRPTQERPTGE